MRDVWRNMLHLFTPSFNFHRALNTKLLIIIFLFFLMGFIRAWAEWLTDHNSAREHEKFTKQWLDVSNSSSFSSHSIHPYIIPHRFGFRMQRPQRLQVCISCVLFSRVAHYTLCGLWNESRIFSLSLMRRLAGSKEGQFLSGSSTDPEDVCAHLASSHRGTPAAAGSNIPLASSQIESQKEETVEGISTQKKRKTFSAKGTRKKQRKAQWGSELEPGLEAYVIEALERVVESPFADWLLDPQQDLPF